MVIALFVLAVTALGVVLTLAEQVRPDRRAAFRLFVGGGLAVTFVCGMWFLLGTQFYDLMVFDEKKGERRTAAYQIEKDEVGPRGTFGDMFGVVGAFFSALSLLGVAVGLVYQQRQLNEQQKEIRTQNRRERKREREAKEVLLIDISQRFWEPDFYKTRQRAWELVTILTPPLRRMDEFEQRMSRKGIDETFRRSATWGTLLADTLSGKASEALPAIQANPNGAIDTLADGVATAMMMWMTRGTPKDRSNLTRELNQFLEFFDFVRQHRPIECNGGTAFTRHRIDGLPESWEVVVGEMVTDLAQVLNLYGTFASVWTQEVKRPLTNYMGNQWEWWGPFVMLFAEKYAKCRKRIDQPPAFWEPHLRKYDAMIRAEKAKGAAPSPPYPCTARPIR